MKYALLIYQDAEFDRFWSEGSAEERAPLYAEYGRFGAMLEERGAMAGGAELAVSGLATTVRSNGGDHVVTDGPYTEVAEHLGGFYLVEARDLDEALEYARALPSDVVEVRPVVGPEDRA